MQTIVPSKEQMRRYLELGLSQAQIAAKYEEDTGIRCSRSAIGMAIGRYGLKSSTLMPRHMDTVPWAVKPEHRNEKHLRLLRLEGRRRKGLKLSETELSWVQGFLDYLTEQDAVVAYNPKTKKGFWLVKREEQDAEGDIVRRPKEKVS